MIKKSLKNNFIPKEILNHYQSGLEINRLSVGAGKLEFERTLELLKRYLPSPPVVIFDIGGGPGIYSLWLAQQGYEVHLIDALALHINHAKKIAQNQPDYPIASFTVGDARKVDRADNSVDVVLLLGPLYHLTKRNDRLIALHEAYRILNYNGIIFAVGISRFASILDGLFSGFLEDPEFVNIADNDIIDGQHRNPTKNLTYFTTAYFHLPNELKEEIEEAGFHHDKTIAIDGPGWLLQNFEEHWCDKIRRERLLNVIRSLEDKPSMLGVSAHILVIGKKNE